LPLTTNVTNPVFVGLPTMVYLDRNLRTPYVEQVSLSVQRELLRDTVLEIAYVGKFGHRLLYGNESNPAVYAPRGNADELEQLPHHSGLGQSRGNGDFRQFFLPWTASAGHEAIQPSLLDSGGLYVLESD